MAKARIKSAQLPRLVCVLASRLFDKFLFHYEKAQIVVTLVTGLLREFLKFDKR